MIISFAWTTDALLAGHKHCTRRMWDEKYLAQWQRAFDRGHVIHDAYDRSPRIGGHKVGQIKLTCRPYRERLADMPDQDLIEEGGLWSSKSEFIELFGGPDLTPVVIRFELIKTP